MNNETNKQRGLIIGTLIGAILGAGAAYLLMVAPSDPEDERQPITGGELISLTSAAAVLFRKLDDIRRRT
jgi:gas vesicle protein